MGWDDLDASGGAFVASFVARSARCPDRRDWSFRRQNIWQLKE
jgi:hypothetical protein